MFRESLSKIVLDAPSRDAPVQAALDNRSGGPGDFVKALHRSPALRITSGQRKEDRSQCPPGEGVQNHPLGFLHRNHALGHHHHCAGHLGSQSNQVILFG